MKSILFTLICILSCISLLSSCDEAKEADTKIINNTIIVPTIVDVEPADNISDVPINSKVSVIFSEQMDEATLTTNGADTACTGSIQISADNFETCIPLTYDTTRDAAAGADNKFAYQIKPSQVFEILTVYKLKLTTDIKSLNRVKISDEYITPNGFTTGIEVTIPTITSTGPADDASEVKIDSTISVTFSEEMDASTITTTSFVVSEEGGASVSGSIAVNGLTAVFTPSTRLGTDTTYEVSLNTDIKSSAGRSLDYDTNFSFTTSSINVVIGPNSGNTTESGEQTTFDVYLNSQPDSDVNLVFNSSNLTEGTVSPTSLTFTISNWSTPQTVTVTGVDDSQHDGSVGYLIDFTVVDSDDK